MSDSDYLAVWQWETSICSESQPEGPGRASLAYVRHTTSRKEDSVSVEELSVVPGVG